MVPAVGIAARNLTKVYGDGAAQIEALRGVSFYIPPGSFATIVGPSGCGKSTLLRILAGLVEQTSGDVYWTTGSAGDGKGNVAAPQVAMVFQGHSVFPWLNVFDNVGYGLWIRGVSRRERKKIVDRWLERLGLTEFAAAYPHQLSGGMRQRVGVARALALDPDVLLMDEPFSALDAQTRLLLQEELVELWQDAGKTVVFVTHSIDEALFLSDIIFVMSRRPGQIIDRIEVPLSRPRDITRLKQDERYGQLYEHIWRRLKAESSAQLRLAAR